MPGALTPDLVGRVAVVTGANSGLGLATARAMAGAGATVVLACRSPDRSAAACAEVAAIATGEPPEAVALDLADLASVAACADTVAGRYQVVDVLVNNAGVMALPPQVTADGFEMQMGTNHLGHFALTAHLLPLLAARGGRVVTVTSVAARLGDIRLDDLQSEQGYEPWAAYARSKQANLLFALELHRRSSAAGGRLSSLAAHPGYAATELVRNGPALLAGPLARRVSGLVDLVAPSAAHGARSQILAATDPRAASGTFYGPRGPAGLAGRAHRARVPRNCSDPRLAAGLWEASEAAIGLPFDVTAPGSGTA